MRDLPGVVIRPVVTPGADVGVGDLSVNFDMDSSPSYRHHLITLEINIRDTIKSALIMKTSKIFS